MESEREVQPSNTTSGFWSYAHVDNSLDDGAILTLADHVKREYNLLSGTPLDLFVDSDSLAWGEEWRTRIDGALTETTFFIPIITPRYFTRPECRRELFEFSGKAKGLGVDELILPILYVKPPDFTSDNPDEAIALVARMQYADWTATRLMEFGSREYRTAVNRLAVRLMEIERSVVQRQFDREVRAGDQEQNTAGIGDLMSEAAKLIPDWLDAVLGSRVANSQMDATWHEVYDPVHKLKKAHAPASGIFSAQLRAGKEILPILERHQRDARTYLARSVELDPIVSSLSSLTTAHPEDFALVLPLREAIDEAITNITRMNELPPDRQPISDHFVELKQRARIFQQCLAVSRDGDRLAAEGNQIVLRWDTALRRPEC